MATVDQILREIATLSDDDRLQLEQRLAERLESQWQHEAAKARAEAAAAGIDQSAIDRTIERRRHGR